MATTIPGMLNATEAAEYAGVANSLVRRYCRLGVFKAQRIGRNWVIPKREIDRFLSNRPPRGNPNFRK